MNESGVRLAFCGNKVVEAKKIKRKKKRNPARDAELREMERRSQ